jgi:hypothetical protein
VDAADALADLTEISAQVDAAVVVDARGGEILAATTDEEHAERLARAGLELLRLVEERVAAGRTPVRLEAALREASVFAARRDGRVIVARTGPSPTSALVLHDLDRCLAVLAAKPKRRGKKVPAGA